MAVFSAEVENLAYFMRFAQAALSKAAADMERQGFRAGHFGVRRGLFPGQKKTNKGAKQGRSMTQPVLTG